MASPKKNHDTRKDNGAGTGAEKKSPAPHSPKAKEAAADGGRRVVRPLLSLGFALCAVLLFVALVDYQKNQTFYFSDSGAFLSSLAKTTPLNAMNCMGKLGSTIAVLLFSFAGLGAFFVPASLFAAAWRAWSRRAHTFIQWRIMLMIGAFFSLVILLSLFDPKDTNPASLISLLGFGDFIPEGAGGRLGNYLYREFAGIVFGRVGAFVIFSLIYAFWLLGVFVENPHRRIAACAHLLRDYWEKRRESRRRREIQRRAAAAAAIAKAPIATAKTPPAPAAPAEEAVPAGASTDLSDMDFLTVPVAPIFPGESPDEEIPPAATTPGSEESPDDSAAENTDFDEFTVPTFPEDSPAAVDTPVPPPAEVSPPPSPPPAPPTPAVETPVPPPFPSRRASRHAPSQLTIHGEAVVERSDYALTPKKKGTYQFPPISLLNEPPPPEATTPEDYNERAERLANTLYEFKIKVELGEVQTGPVITRYEVIPAPGVRVEKIAGLANNIAMNLKAESVRVLAPVPGKGTVGIEVPNRNPKAVSLREIIESKAWETNKHDIPIVLGKDVTGKPIITDLARMPHCLIAGSTGSGKSVCINGIVASLAYHAGPDDIRFIMVDPKVVELQIYNKLPHMLIPVVTDPKKVPAALKWLLAEMDRRYQIFARTGMRNIASFNAKLTKDQKQAELARQMDLELSPEERAASAALEVPRDDDTLEIPDKKLPYIVCFIDELADLMMVAPADIETAIARLAQLARAAGIHLILATQRPSVNVITGIIKANLPCRIAFKVTSVVDSRTILDQKGAENLIGRGDMLFIPPGSAHLMRAQGAFVSDEEIRHLVEHIALCNGEPEFADDVQEIIEKTALEDSDDNTPTEGTDDPSEDPMLMKAWEVIRATKKASTSFLQRRLSIGYGRAAKIIDALEERGYIGPDMGPGNPREILKE
jgi:S-DNA-T family DNA segregation ATPase FtsK/SpoIIIE